MRPSGTGSNHTRSGAPVLPPPHFRPLYTISELVRYAGTKPSTARAWLRGYRYQTLLGRRQAAPVAGSYEGSELRSFADLVEVAAIAAARRAHVPLQRLRIGIDAARELYGWERPLLIERFRHDGRDVFIQDPDSNEPVNLSRWGQIAWAHIQDVLKDLDYESEIATKWWPLGRNQGIVVDPAVSFGRPVLEPYGVSTVAIAQRFGSGESIGELADDYEIPSQLIERALYYEQPRRLAA